MHVRCSRILALAALIAASGLAADGASVAGETPPGDDLFMAGGAVRIDQPVQGDLIVVGGNEDFAAPVTGDVAVGGGNVRLASEVGTGAHR